ncbi:DUF697 domain-containing protein [uncultured Anaerovibrio sp.]|uniref:DUF697 domain-containing protein n=1 Tax=uncultured Anaerovibrio sp. TaxID=361586 RepID=UPI0025EAFD01|nr:DUF697 domain-containing protein [uncultured Anaerovibrio sp.]
MTNEQYEACQYIIHSAAAASAAAGALPIPGSDSVAIVAAQTAMVFSLSKVFDVRLTQASAEAMALTTITKYSGRLVAGGLIKLIPFAGTVVGGCVNATVAASITETMGWEVARDFDRQAA